MAALVLVCLLAGAAETGSSLFRKGRKAEKSGEWADAYLYYSWAAAASPEVRKYWLHSQAVRSRAALQAKVKPPVRDAGPSSEAVVPTRAAEEDLAEARKPQPPPHLAVLAGLRDFDERGDSKQLYESITRAFGIDTVFDGDFEAGKSTRFRVSQVDYRDALRLLGSATGSFAVPISSKLILVAKDTQAKRNDLEPGAAVTIPIPEPVSLQEAQEVSRTVQQALEIRRLSVDTNRRFILINDRTAKVEAAKALVEQLMTRRPEVVLELEFLEVNRTDSLKAGLGLPTQFSLVNLASARTLATLGVSTGTFGLTLTGANVVAQFSNAVGKTLLRAIMRSADGQAATFHVGDRYPILTGGYFGAIPPDSSGQVYRPPPSFNFEDLGVNVKATPKVHGADEVSLELEAEFKVISGSGFNGIPIISNRKLNSKLRIRDGEWGVVAGLLSTSEARTLSGIAGLAALPGIGPLVSTNSRDRGESSVYIVIKPHVLHLPPDQRVTRTIWLGTETRMNEPL